MVFAMTAAARWDLVSEEDYLRGELLSDQKHEYVGGVVHAMAGAKNRHNMIVGNVFAALHARLRGKPCTPWNSDTKVRIRLAAGTRFYYPDAMVVCRPNPDGDTFQDEPAVILEVLSDSTRRIDEEEKKDAYLTIPSLGVYAMVEPDSPVAVVFRRTETGFQRSVIAGLERVISLPEANIELPLADVYDGVPFEE
jgi:Uma2 family endonuclease